MDKKDRGINAVNQEFARYEGVEKRQEYRLAESPHHAEELFDEDYEIRTCDLGLFLNGDDKDRERFARDLGRAVSGIGFAILEGHGVDPTLYAEAERHVLDVFTKSTDAEKARFRAKRHGSVNQGYFPLRETSEIHPDLVEGWVFCRRAFDLGEEPVRVEDFWPSPEAEAFFRKLCLEHERLILPVMQSLLRYLRCDPHLYDDKLTKTNFGLRLNYYPPMSLGDQLSGAGRLLGHEDVDLFTFLPAPTIDGLQVLNRRNMKWIRLEAPPGTLILNTGDYMQRISNDRLPSTTHRVSRPGLPTDRLKPRVSFPMNVYLWEHETLEVLPGLGNPKYPPVQAIDFHTSITKKYYGDDYAVTR